MSETKDITEQHKIVAGWLTSMHMHAFQEGVLRDSKHIVMLALDTFYTNEVAKRLPDHTALLLEIVSKLEELSARPIVGDEGFAPTVGQALKSLSLQISKILST